jgi:hypothetical protein
MNAGGDDRQSNGLIDRLYTACLCIMITHLHHHYSGSWLVQDCCIRVGSFAATPLAYRF